MDKIIEFKQALRYFQVLIPATKEHKERIQKEMKKQDLLMSAVSPKKSSLHQGFRTEEHLPDRDEPCGQQDASHLNT